MAVSIAALNPSEFQSPYILASAFMALTHVIGALDSLKDQAKDALWALSSCLCQQSAKVKINGRTC